MDFINTLLMLGQKSITIIIALFGIGFLIGFHEFGHFIFCKLFGIKTPTFSIGFGTILFQRKIGDTQFTLSAIPLGGFVEIAGAAEVGQGEQKHAQSTEKDSFAVKPYYQKFLVMMGGIFCNLIFAYFAFILLSLIGIPKTPLMPSQIKTVIENVALDSAAAHAGLQQGDYIHTVNSVAVTDDIQKLYETVQPLANKQAQIGYERNGAAQEVTVTMDKQKGATGGSLGIAAFKTEGVPPRSFFEAIKQGIFLTNDFIIRTFSGLIGMFKNADFKNAGGPVVIISSLASSAASSLSAFLILLAIISINLAILNLLPFPILDGGQLLFYTIEAIVGRQLPSQVRQYIFIASWILMMGLILYLTVFDVARIAQPYIASAKQAFGLQ